MSIHFPTHFTPHTESPSTTPAPPDPGPSQLIDLFCIRATPDQPATLLAVLGTLVGGALLVAPASTFPQLSSAVRDQIQSVLVSRRSQVRTITAAELAIFSLEAIEQHSQVQGFNDAVTGYGRLQALIHTAGATTITPVAQDGRLHLGRLDLLNAYQAGLPEAFRNPHMDRETVYHFFLPLGPPAVVAKGRDVGLVYPLIYIEVMHRFENTAFVLRIVYDLLVRLQQDVTREQPTHPFATLPLPLPNRPRVESELRTQHYTIHGNIATQDLSASEPANQPDSAQQTPFWLAKLRRFTQQWSAPRILLPPQATPAAYATLIQTVLPALLTVEDKAMAQALQRLTTPVSPQEPPTTAAAPSVLQPPAPITPPPAIPATPGQRPKTAPLTDQSDWAQDFAGTLDSAPRSAPTQPSARRWWQDFPSEVTPVTERQLTVGNELDELVTPDQTATPDETAKHKAWALDFSSDPPPSPTSAARQPTSPADAN